MGEVVAEGMGLGTLQDQLAAAPPGLPDADRPGLRLRRRLAAGRGPVRRRLGARLERLGELQEAGGAQAFRGRQRLGQLVAGAPSRVVRQQTKV